MNAMITELKAAQVARRETASALRDARYNEVVSRAMAERDIIAAAGGVKALGSNEAERDRAMTLALNELVSGGKHSYAIAFINIEDAEDTDRFARDTLEVARAVIALETTKVKGTE